MRIIFLGLAIWNTIFFVATVYVGETMHQGDFQTRFQMHFTFGLVTAIFTILTHSVVMIHFMGTGKGVKEAVEAYSLPDDPHTGYVRRTKRFKARTSGLATLAPFLVIVTTWLGAARHTMGTSVLWHAVLAYFAVAFNVYAFVVEYRAIAENSAMIKEINKLIAAKKQG